MKTRHYTLTKEGEDTAPTGFITDRYPQTNLGGGMKEGQVEKQYPGTEHDNLLIADNGIQSQGGQAINPKPDEETATIGDDNLGAGEAPIYSTYPYPPNPDPNLGVPENSVLMPKLQVTGPPQDSYGVRNTMSNSSNFGAVADNQLQDVVQRVEAAIMAEVMASKDPMTLEASSPIKQDLPPGWEGFTTHDQAQVKQDGNEIVAPDGTMIQPNGQSGFDGRTQIPQQTPKAEEQPTPKTKFPQTIVFDWNGTVDARGLGRGIPIDFLSYLMSIGKDVAIFTSSTTGDDKTFMREECDRRGIPYTDNETILDQADVFIGDKKSDERRAGKHGAKWIHVQDFDADKLLAKSVTIPGMNRTAIGDSWDGNANDYREGGAPIVMNTPSQRDVLLQLLRARGFVDNENNPLSQGIVGGRLRLEHKMGGAIAMIEGSQDNQRLEVTITDRTGRPELITSDWSKLYGYLGEKFPRQDD